MENNAVQENPVPENIEKEKRLKKIVSLGENISASHKSIKIVGVLNMFAAFGYLVAAMAELHSPFLFPIILTVLAGNQVYIFRTRNKQKKLDEMKKTYESEFGVITSSD